MAHNGKGNGRSKKWETKGYPHTIPIDPFTGKKGISDVGVVAGIGAAAVSIPALIYLKKKKKEANQKAHDAGKSLPYPFTGKSPKKKRDKSISKTTQPYGAKEGGVVDTTKFRYIE